MKHVLLFLAILATWTSRDAMGDENPAVAKLVTDAVDFSQPFTVGVYFSILPEWYLYWKNPGDAGLSVAVTWSLPEGFVAGDLQYPTPEKIVHGDVVAYGYHNTLLLTATITPPPGYRSRAQDSITARINWLVCSERCVPGKATLSMILTPPSEGDRKYASALRDQFLPRMPLNIGQIGVSVSDGVVLDADHGSVIRITLEGAGGKGISDFFPEPLEDAVIDFRKITVSSEKITIPFSGYSTSVHIPQIAGLLMAGGKGYALRCTVRQSSSSNK